MNTYARNKESQAGIPLKHVEGCLKKIDSQVKEHIEDREKRASTLPTCKDGYWYERALILAN